MIPFSTFVRVYLRSFFIQGSFSIKFRQNVGFAFCMDPVGKVLWTENEDRRAFLNRHLEYYNGNPFMITLVLGAIAGLEEHYKNDDGITERDINGFKRAVGAATGSVGDRIFWSTLRPLSVIIGLLAASLYGLWGAATVLVLFNVPNLILRWYWLKKGYHLGTGVVTEIQNKNIDSAVGLLETAKTLIAAFLVSSLVLMNTGRIDSVSAAATAVFAVSLYLFRKGMSVSVVFLSSLLLSVMAGLLFVQIIYY
ncbi:MAG: PTS mannose/fructose/sorbose transporter family subunit IID [Candidatus Latescibacteria bacterium]|nr:PTS mannose/fructose/sorbose transporter family subunit IID [Candidatus Latescibacterota bacterium]